MIKFLKKENLLRSGLILILLLFLFFLLCQKIDLTTTDLGRHIKNGQMILKGGFNVLKTNFYSYSNTDFSFLNHHWLSGVIFYLFYKLAGFSAVHLLILIILLVTFLLFFRTAEKTAGTAISSFIALAIIPLMAYRHGVRPEAFSYFLAALFFFLLNKFSRNEISFKKLLFIPLIQIIWINLHIYAFLGPLIVLAFLIEKLLKKQKETTKKLGVLLLLCLLACLISPFGLKALLYPLNIFKNYGYRLLENQSVFFLENLKIKNPVFTLFKITLALLLISFLYLIFKKRRQIPFTEIILAGGISLAGLMAVRNLSLFGFFALPILAKNIAIILPKVKTPLNEKSTDFKIGLLTFALLIIILSFVLYSPDLKSNSFWGIGLSPGSNGSIEFFKENNLSGPIFNNYDIGSYLVFHLYPQEKVFIDNRPEAYPAEFLQNVYIAMQQESNLWQEKDRQYGFNTIFFNYHDATPWSQNFLIERLKDKDWAPVFVDDYAIIFLKRNVLNKEIIEKFEIAEDRFKITEL